MIYLEAEGSYHIPDVPLIFEAREVFHKARELAQLPLSGRRGNAHMGTEHVLLPLIEENADVKNILQKSGINSEAVLIDLRRYISYEDDNLPPINEDGLTPTVVTLIENAKLLASRNKQDKVTPIHLLGGLVDAGRGKALMTLGMHLGFPESDRSLTPLIQDALWEYIPLQREIH